MERSSATLIGEITMSSPQILVTGVSGPIGAALLPSLHGRGYKVTRLVRGSAHAEDQLPWDPSQPLSPQSVSGFQSVIHLAGESIVGRWSESKKARILNSRVQGTRHLAEALAQASPRPRVWISASAVGYYGDRGEEILREDSPAGSGFLPEVCRQWEAATQPAVDAGIRVVLIRIGMVLSPAGGALGKMLFPFKMGLGGNVDSGKQWWSWIDVRDLVGAMHHVMKTDLLQGPVNFVAPKAVTNAEFTRTLASVLKRPAIFPMPAFAAHLAFGEMADELLLASQRVEAKKLIGSGYPFQYPDLRRSLESLIRK
ncbi:MAG TPA: TIGR01777 family oxidoreductase [Terriglobales bacterium]|nr:TIGR01777 family oxidoreductase [Terriglobales bacterium]